MGGRSVRLKYLHAFRDRTGTLRFYFRRNGIRTKLPGLFGSREFLDAYAAALGDQCAQPAERNATLPGSFRALATRYFASPQFLSLSATSQTNYRRAIDRFLIEHGHRRVDQMKREHVDAVLGKFVDKPGAGIILLKRMRTLLRYAIEIGWRDGDPTAGVRAFKSVEIHTWTESDVNLNRGGQSEQSNDSRSTCCSTQASGAATWHGWYAQQPAKRFVLCSKRLAFRLQSQCIPNCVVHLKGARAGTAPQS